MRIRSLRKIQALKKYYVREKLKVERLIVIDKGSIIACLIKHFTYPQNGDIKYKIRN